jgi:membrane protease subunit (stomatin/prohibitin family)
MALIDVVKYQAEENEFIWKFPSNDLRIGTQVVVNPAQHAFFIKGGIILDEFTSGTHTVKTENIPLLNKIINLPFGGNSPFQAEVWYVNLLSKLDNKWGTTNPILLEDPKYGIIIPVRAFGQFGFKISNPRIFLETLTGNLPSFSADKIQEYFKGKIISSLTSLISKKLVRENISILEINVFLDELSLYCQENISDEFKKFGLEIVNFYFMSINVPLDDPSVVKLKEAKDLAAKVKITGKELYQMDRSFDVLDNAAKNEGGVAGNLMGAGLGLGLGVGVGNQMSNVSGNLNTQNTPPPPPPPTTFYYVLINNQQNGPLSFDQLKQLIVDVRLNKQTMIWKTGMENWVLITEIPEVSNLFNQTPPPPPAV